MDEDGVSPLRFVNLLTFLFLESPIRAIKADLGHDPFIPNFNRSQSGVCQTCSRLQQETPRALEDSDDLVDLIWPRPTWLTVLCIPTIAVPQKVARVEPKALSLGQANMIAALLGALPAPETSDQLDYDEEEHEEPTSPADAREILAAQQQRKRERPHAPHPPSLLAIASYYITGESEHISTTKLSATTCK